MGPAVTRRGLLVGGGLLLVAACTGGPRPAAPSTSAAPAAADPLLALLTDREELLARCEATGSAHPDLVGRLQPVRDNTAEHVVALRLALALPTSTPTTTPTVTPTAGSPSSPSDTDGASGSGPPSASGPVVAADPAVALADVRAAVRSGGDLARSTCLGTTSERAPLVGSLSAAAACHDLVLT